MGGNNNKNAILDLRGPFFYEMKRANECAFVSRGVGEDFVSAPMNTFKKREGKTLSPEREREGGGSYVENSSYKR